MLAIVGLPSAVRTASRDVVCAVERWALHSAQHVGATHAEPPIGTGCPRAGVEEPERCSGACNTQPDRDNSLTAPGGLRYRRCVPSLSTLPMFIASSLALLVVPGPAVLFIVARSSSQGTRAGLVSVLGVHSASVVHVMAAVAGLSAIVVASALAFTALKVVGGLYLIHLGIKSIRSARRLTAITPPVIKPERRLFAEAFTVNLLNPKVAIFFLAFLPQFVSNSRGPVWSQTLVLGLVYITLGLYSDSMYALLESRIGSWFGGHVAKVRALRYAEGGILVGLGVLTLALPHRRATK